MHCGRIMDVIRWPYRSQMLLYTDQPVLVWGRWEFCQPEAETVPYLHPWGSGFLRMDDGLDLVELGEVKRRWILDEHNQPPATTAMPGVRLCGTREQWQGGTWAQRGSVVVDADGVPICCGGDAQGEGDVDGDEGEQLSGLGIPVPGGDVDGEDTGGTGYQGGLTLGQPPP
jgi:hypothetical protein